MKVCRQCKKFDSYTTAIVQWWMCVYRAELWLSCRTTGFRWLCVSSTWSDSASFVLWHVRLNT